MKFEHGAWMMRHNWMPLMDADGGGSGGSGAGGQGGSGGAGGGEGGNQPFAIFPDEQSFMARITREGKKLADEMAKKLGFESFEKMQEAAKAKLDLDKQGQTELEKALAAQKEAEEKGKKALETANQRLINAEIKIFAVDAKFVDPDDAVALIDRSGIQIDENGKITGVKEAVEALAKAKPHLIGEGKPGGSPGSAGNGERQTGGGTEKGAFGKGLAEKRANAGKNSAQAQSHYFG